MKTRLVTLILIIPALMLSGCGRNFRLNRSEEISPSQWPFVRKDIQSTAQIESDFKGWLNLKWERGTGETPIGPLTIGFGHLVFCGSKGKISFFNLETGKFLGRHKNGYGVQTGAVIADSLAYFAVGPKRNRFYCINSHNRQTIWSMPLKDVTGAPIIIDNKLYVVSDSGIVFGLGRLTGEVIWRSRDGSKSTAGISYADGIIYLPSDDGKLRALKESDGEMVFQIDMMQPLVSKAAIGDKVYVAGAGGGFFALDKKTGQLLWQKEFPWPIWTSPALDDKIVYLGDNGGYLRALDTEDGRTLWEFKAAGVIISSPIIVGDFVLFASLDRNVYCLDKRTGLMVSKRELKHEIRFPAVSDGRRIYVVAHDGTIQCFGD